MYFLSTIFDRVSCFDQLSIVVSAMPVLSIDNNSGSSVVCVFGSDDMTTVAATIGNSQLNCSTPRNKPTILPPQRQFFLLQRNVILSLSF